MPPTNETHYTLNTKQLEILRLLYRFRFATSTHLATSLDINSNKVNQRLQILLDQTYIGRNYDGQYKIHGKPAEYYLLANGIVALKQQMGDKCNPSVLHSIYKDKDATEQTITHYLTVFTVYCELLKRYGAQLRFFTRSQIRQYDYFPKQRPDALVRLVTNERQKEFFLEVMHMSKPFFPYVGKVKRYLEYADDGTWQEKAGTKFPAILLVCDSVGLQIRIQKQAGRLIRKHYDEDLRAYATSIDEFSSLQAGLDRVWRDVEESEKRVRLEDM